MGGKVSSTKRGQVSNGWVGQFFARWIFPLPCTKLRQTVFIWPSWFISENANNIATYLYQSALQHSNPWSCNTDDGMPSIHWVWYRALQQHMLHSSFSGFRHMFVSSEIQKNGLILTACGGKSLVWHLLAFPRKNDIAEFVNICYICYL